MVYSRVHRSFLLFPCIFRKWRIQGNPRKRIFSSVHRSVNVQKLLCSCVYRSFLTFSLTANARECKKTLVFQMFIVRWTFGKYRVFLCLQESSCIFWDSKFQWIQVNACFQAINVFISFSCISWDGVFGCFSVSIGQHCWVTPTPCSRFFWSFYSPMTCWLPMFIGLKLIPFPSQNSKNKRHC